MEINLILSEDWIKASNEFSEYARQITRYGFYKRLNTKQQEQQGSNEQGRVSLKNSGKVPEGARHPALLRKQERDNLLQDSPLRIPSGATFTITLSEQWDKARKDWYSFCETNES